MKKAYGTLIFYLIIAAIWALMAWDSFHLGKTGFAWLQTILSAGLAVRGFVSFFKK